MTRHKARKVEVIEGEALDIDVSPFPLIPVVDSSQYFTAYSKESHDHRSFTYRRDLFHDRYLVRLSRLRRRGRDPDLWYSRCEGARMLHEGVGRCTEGICIHFVPSYHICSPNQIRLVPR